MIRKAAERIAKFFCKGSKHSDDIQEVYQYEIELAISTSLNILLIVPISAVLQDILSGLVFLTVFIVIRSFTEGHNAKTYFVVLTFLLVWCAAQGVALISDADLAYRLLEVITLLGLIPIIAYAPVENRILDKNRRKRYQIIGVVLYIFFAISAFVIETISIKYCAIIILTLSAVSIMVIIEYLRIRR